MTMEEEIQKLLAAGKIAKDQAGVLEALVPGRICSHAGFGVGKVASWDLLGDRIVVDFESKPAHAMGLRIALKTLKPLAATHILAQYLADPAAIRELAADDPVAFVGNVLRGNGGSMGLDEFDALVKNRIVDESAYKKWWDGAKKHLRGHREFIVPSKRNEPLQLRESDLSPAEQLIEDFDLARDLKDKARLLGEMRKHLDLFADPVAELGVVVTNAGEIAMKSQKVHPAGAIELMLARDALAAAIKGYKLAEGEPTLATLVRVEAKHLHDALKVLPAAAAGAVAEVLPEAYGETWAETALQLLDGCGPKAFAELAQRLARGEAAPAFELWIRRGLAQRNHGPDALGWLCQQRSGPAGGFFGPDLGLALLDAIDRIFTASGGARGNRALDVLQNDMQLIAGLLEGASENEVRTFAKRLMATPAIDDPTRRSLLARVIKVHAFVQEMVIGEPNSSASAVADTLQVSQASLERKQAELDDLVRNLIPENTRQIAIAREYGDLRENFEFKSAKENQKVLDRRKFELEREIQRARVVDYSAADTSSIQIGTVATVACADGVSRRVAVVGAWDGDPAHFVLSYLSPAGTQLLGRKPGDSVAIPGGEDGDMLAGEIRAIDRWSADG